MNMQNEKEFRCKVRTDTTYGKKVLRCVELLKDRTGLAVTNLIQEALISYEQVTREKENMMGAVMEQSVGEKQDAYVEESKEEQSTFSNDLLRLSAGDAGGF